MSAIYIKRGEYLVSYNGMKVTVIKVYNPWDACMSVLSAMHGRS